MMKTRIIAYFAAAVLLLNMAGFAAADTRGVKKNGRQSNALVALLPASDGVVTVDSGRFFSDAMPKILASNQPMLSEIMAQLDEMQAKTGINLRKFDSVAIGVAIAKTGGKTYEFDPVAIARGDLRSGALVAIAKLASNGTYREEKIGERTVYVFSAKDVLQKAGTPNNGSKISSMIHTSLTGLTREIAVTTLDDKTLAFGSLNRVRETIGAKTHVSPEVSGLLSDKESSILTFAMRAPEGMSKLLPLDNDELGANIDSIRFMSGSLDVAAAGMSMQVIAKTVKPEQAKGLYETLDGLKIIGKAFLGNSKRPDQKIYARLIENAAIGLHGNAVTLDLLVPQSDIDTLIGAAIK